MYHLSPVCTSHCTVYTICHCLNLHLTFVLGQNGCTSYFLKSTPQPNFSETPQFRYVLLPISKKPGLRATFWRRGAQTNIAQ